MSNLTISVADDLIRRARMRAIEQGTSLSAKVRDFLERYVDEADDALNRQRAESADRLMVAIEAATAQTRPVSRGTFAKTAKRRPLREELYGADFRAMARVPAKARKASSGR